MSTTEDTLEAEREAKKATEQAILDEEMRKRRERVRLWQEEKAKKLTPEVGPTTSGGDGSANTGSGIGIGSGSCTDVQLSADERQKMRSQSMDVVDVDVDGGGGGGDNGGLGTSASTHGPHGWSLEDDDDDKEGDVSAVHGEYPDGGREGSGLMAVVDDEEPIGPPPLPRKPDNDEESVVSASMLASLTPGRAAWRSLGIREGGSEAAMEEKEEEEEEEEVDYMAISVYDDAAVGSAAEAATAAAGNATGFTAGSRGGWGSSSSSSSSGGGGGGGSGSGGAGVLLDRLCARELTAAERGDQDALTTMLACLAYPPYLRQHDLEAFLALPL